MRIAIIDYDKCHPDRCGLECIKYCPPVRSGNIAIEIPEGAKKPVIYEDICTGCGICPDKCRFHAPIIVNTPEQVEEELTHRFGENGFALFRLPLVKLGGVTGLIGQNGIGKSTSLKILSGELIPNFGDFDEKPSWERVLERYKGTELQNYFKKMVDKEIRTVHKPQYVSRIPKVIKGTVKDVLTKVDERGVALELKDQMGLEKVWSRNIANLSGGELQKLAIAVAISRDADLYLFDEPSSYLDVSERMKMGKLIHSLVEEDRNKTIIVVEHDLTILDYVSDYVCMFYGEPGAFGVVSHPYGVKEGVNAYLRGYIPDENMRFRKEEIILKKTSIREEIESAAILFSYNAMKKAFNGFTLDVNPGYIRKGEVIGILGPNGIGKTTFVKLLAGVEKPTEGNVPMSENLKVAYKPQYLKAEEGFTVRTYLLRVGATKLSSGVFKSTVLRPFGLERLMDQDLNDLSGGELQKVAVAATLAIPADLYLFDEPSAFLSLEDRLVVAKAIRKTIQDQESAAFVVEHDLIFQDYVADATMVFRGEPGVHGIASPPKSMKEGMNEFLKDLKVTFRRDPDTGRPRVNKAHSKKERIQIERGEYYYVDR